jgi:hypothetical protein
VFTHSSADNIINILYAKNNDGCGGGGGDGGSDRSV